MLGMVTHPTATDSAAVEVVVVIVVVYAVVVVVNALDAVSYTHLTLPTIYSV